MALNLNIAQSQVYFDQLIEPDSPKYNVGGYVQLCGVIDVELFCRAIKNAISEFDCFSSVILWDNSIPIQRINESNVAEDVVLHDFTFSGGSEQALAWIVGRFNICFTFESNLYECAMLKLGEHEWWWYLRAHHVIMDGYSFSVLVGKVAEIYNNLIAGIYVDNDTKQKKYIYDSVLAGDHYYSGTGFEKDRFYWKERIKKIPPLVFERPKCLSGGSYTHEVEIPTALKSNLIKLSESLRCGFQEILLSIVFIYMHRLYGVNEQCIGVPLHGRRTLDQKKAVGMYAQMLPVRIEAGSNETLRSLIEIIKRSLRSDYKHSRYPLNKIIESFSEVDAFSRGVFEVAAIYDNFNFAADFVGVSSEIFQIQSEFVSTPVEIRLKDYADNSRLKLLIKARSDIFDAYFSGFMLDRFLKILTDISVNFDSPIKNLNVITDSERHLLLVERNNTTADYPKDKCIHELFEAQVENNPNAVAVIFEDQQLTYGELNTKANQLAHYLINEKQVKPDSLVGICVERSLEVMIGILGILKAGGAYVPLDPEYPAARLAYMLEDANLTTVLTQGHLRKATPISDAQALCLDDEETLQQLQLQSTQNPNPHEIGLTSSHLAYVIYTSGSTESSKGVMIQRAGLRNLMHWYTKAFLFDTKDVFLIISSISFDLTQKNLYAPLITGGTIILSSQKSLDSEVILSEINHHHVTAINCAPSVLYPLIESRMSAGYKKLETLRLVLLGGEPINLKFLRSWMYSDSYRASLINMYGPTECTDIATRYCCEIGGDRAYIGSPIDNVQLYVLNEFHQLLAIDTPGELYIGGAGLARGYLNRSDLTAEKFIPNPFYDPNNPASSERLYKTGDLVRWLPDGNLEFLGRIDHQVKIRGFRIELGEIENALSTYADVKDAVVLARESASDAGDKRLVAYVATDAVVVQDESDLAIAARQNLITALHQHVSQTLPDYMVPSAFVLLKQLPLTPNGKVDRKALPEPDMSALQRSLHVGSQRGAENTIVDELLNIYAMVLNQRPDDISLYKSFFENGGNSLKAIIFLTKINNAFGVDISIVDFLKASDVVSLSSFVSGSQEVKEW